MTPKFYVFHLILRYKIVVGVVLLILVLFTTQATRKIYLSKDHDDEAIDVVYTWVNGSDPRFLKELKDYLQNNGTYKNVDYSPQRFDDKYELKFSLRSLQKYAPWVRHVYIVTNGQIPYWLNLDYKKVTVISHKEIFPDGNDLPTFSSPAIESHLHRIPGISRKFIYFNDDFFLGAPVYPDDFYSPNRGYLVYLTWQVPPCAPDCPWMYVNDGQCDSQCRNVECQMDGNDCTEENILRDVQIHRSIDTDFQGEETIQSPVVTTRKPSHPRPELPHVFRTNHSDLKRAITEHNKRVILGNKLRRKKMMKKFNSTLIDRVRRIVRPTDTFGESLQHTNRLLNLRYGYKTRFVAAHAPIMIDVGVMEAMQEVFHEGFVVTSRNKLRSVNDMQYSFGYYYFLMQENRDIGVGDIFDKFDTDGSGTWSDREIRTVLTKLYDLPLSYAIVDHFEAILTNCSSYGNFPEVTTPEFERYIDSKLPTISRQLVINCPPLSAILESNFGLKPRYKYDIVSNAHSGDVTFKMINSNVSDVVGHLDEIRRNTNKFICLNDNLENGKDEDNDLVKSVLYDFYLSLFPIPSEFELPQEYRNRFLHVEELVTWKNHHFHLKIALFVVFTVFLYICTFRLYTRRSMCGIYNKIL